MAVEDRIQTIPLQHGIVYGPVASRRLGRSLGINPLPEEIKVCSFNCGYCQYAWTGILSTDPRRFGSFLPGREAVREALETALAQCVREGAPPDALTFSGNGEASLHPEFPGMVEDTVALRDRYVPSCRTAILSNASTVSNPAVRRALLLLDDPILKLDAGREAIFRKLNRPAKSVSFEGVVEGLREMGSRVILQSLFVGGPVDNSTEDEVEAWVKVVRAIGPRHVQIYTLDRGPADGRLRPVSRERLAAISARVLAMGVSSEVYS